MILNRSKMILIISVLVFLGSLAVPAFYGVVHHRDYSHYTGWYPFVIGWFPAIFGLIGFPQGDVEYLGTISWFANPFLIVAWVSISRNLRRVAIGSSIGAICLCLLFLLTKSIPIPDGQTISEVSVGLGYFMWVLSILGALLASAFIERSGDTDSNL